MTVDPDEIVIDLGVRPRPGEQPAVGDPPLARARIRWRPWLIMVCLAALLVVLPDSVAAPARTATADPLPTTSSAPNLNQLNQLDEGNRMYQHGPVHHPQQGPVQWCWIEQPQTGEMSLVPCAEAGPPLIHRSR